MEHKAANIATDPADKKRRKGSRILLIVIGCLALIVLGILLTHREFFGEVFDAVYYGELYSGNRNIGTITVNVDGQSYVLTEGNFTMVGCDTFRLQNSDWDALTIQEDGSAKVELVAGEKGYFGYAVTVDGLEYPMVFKFGHNPKWEVVKYDLTVNVDTKQNTVTCEGHCTKNGDKVTINTEAEKETFSDGAQASLVLGICSVA